MFDAVVQIHMPSGAKIEAYVASQWLNLAIYLPPEDEGRTEGLCGPGRVENDQYVFPEAFRYVLTGPCPPTFYSHPESQGESYV